jgi:hypothetical protein
MNQVSAIVGLRGDLLSIHAAQLRFLDRLVEAAGDSRAHEAALLTGVEAMVALFHSHHGTEEEVVFPEWTAHQKDPVIDRFVAAHRGLEAAARNVETTVGKARNGGDGAATELSPALRTLQALMRTHFADEDNYFTVERIGQVVGEARVAAMGPRIAEHSKAHSNPPWLVLPAVFFNLNDAEWATFRHHYPWFLREILVKMIWKPKWKVMTPFFAYPPP